MIEPEQIVVTDHISERRSIILRQTDVESEQAVDELANFCRGDVHRICRSYRGGLFRKYQCAGCLLLHRTLLSGRNSSASGGGTGLAKEQSPARWLQADPRSLLDLDLCHPRSEHLRVGLGRVQTRRSHRANVCRTNSHRTLLPPRPIRKSGHEHRNTEWPQSLDRRSESAIDNRHQRANEARKDQELSISDVTAMFVSGAGS